MLLLWFFVWVPVFFDNPLKFILGVGFLTIGLAVYVFLRPSDTTFVISWLGLEDLGMWQGARPDWFFSISAALHSLSMTLISAAFLKGTRKNSILIASFWVGINIFFETLQHPEVHSYLYHSLGIKTLGAHLDGFIRYGTYDVYDILFVIAGGLLAILLLEKINENYA